MMIFLAAEMDKGGRWCFVSLPTGFSERKAPFENRFPINSSISGLVAATGETVNIGDLPSDQGQNHT
jgi:hypothetical protein